MLVTLLLTNLAVFAIVWYSIYESRTTYEDRAKIAAQNLSQLLKEDITSILQRVDLGVRTIVDEAEQETKHGGMSDRTIEDFIARRYKSIAQDLPELDALRYADANGIIRNGIGVVAGSHISVADRDYFIRLRDDPNAGLVISKPILGRVSGQWAIAIGRRCNKPDGSFVGVAYAVILVRQFGTLFAKLALGPNGRISLRDLDLEMVATYPVPTGPTDGVGNRAVSLAFQENLRLNADNGTYFARAGLDGINRIFSYRRMTSYPAYIIVGLAADDYLVAWRREAYKLLLMAALFCLTTVVMGLLLWKSWQRKEQEITERKIAATMALEFAARLQVMTRRYADAQESERRSLSRDLHDRVSSSLTAIGLCLGLVKTQLPDDVSTSVFARLSDTEALVRETIMTAREISHDLHPAVLEYGGVLPALMDYGRKFSANTGIAVKVEGDQEIRYPPETEIALYRIAQEALTNCAKYANATTVTITLNGDVEHSTFVISDDGVGFDLIGLTDGKNVPGLGLLSMRERAEAIGGKMTLDSKPGQGTRITVEI